MMVTVARSERPPSGVWPVQSAAVEYLPCRFTLPTEVSGSSSMVTAPFGLKAPSSTVGNSMTFRISFWPEGNLGGQGPGDVPGPFWDARKYTSVSEEGRGECQQAFVPEPLYDEPGALSLCD